MTNANPTPSAYAIQWVLLPDEGRSLPGVHVTRDTHPRFFTAAVLGPHDPRGEVAAQWLVFERAALDAPVRKQLRGVPLDNPRLGYLWVWEPVPEALGS